MTRWVVDSRKTSEHVVVAERVVGHDLLNAERTRDRDVLLFETKQGLAIGDVTRQVIDTEGTKHGRAQLRR